MSINESNEPGVRPTVEDAHPYVPGTDNLCRVCDQPNTAATHPAHLQAEGREHPVPNLGTAAHRYRGEPS